MLYLYKLIITEKLHTIALFYPWIHACKLSVYKSHSAYQPMVISYFQIEANGKILFNSFIKSAERIKVLIADSKIILSTNAVFCQQVARFPPRTIPKSLKKQKVHEEKGIDRQGEKSRLQKHFPNCQVDFPQRRASGLSHPGYWSRDPDELSAGQLRHTLQQGGTLRCINTLCYLISVTVRY